MVTGEMKTTLHKDSQDSQKSKSDQIQLVEIEEEISEILNQIKSLEIKLKKLQKKKSIMTRLECFLEDIPSDLILNFCSFLDPRDISRFGRCQKSLWKLVKHDYLWNLLLKDRFNLQALPGKALELYKENYSKTNILYGTDLRVIWLDDTHWKRVQRSVELVFVWWFEVRGSFLGVRSGRYQPILHGSFRGENLENIHISIRSKVEGQVGVFLFNYKSSISEYIFSDLTDKSQSEIYLPPITVGDDKGCPVFQDLELEMVDLESGLVKQGITIDYFELKKII